MIFYTYDIFILLVTYCILISLTLQLHKYTHKLIKFVKIPLETNVQPRNYQRAVAPINC